MPPWRGPEILDQGVARRLQPVVDIGDARRETLPDLAGCIVERLRQTRADLIDLLDETSVTRVEILDRAPSPSPAACCRRRRRPSRSARSRVSSDCVSREPTWSICSTSPS